MTSNEFSRDRSLSSAFPMTGSATLEFTTSITERTSLIFANLGNYGTVGMMRKIGSSGYQVGSATMMTQPTVALSADLGGPTEARAMKMGVILTNGSPALKRQG